MKNIVHFYLSFVCCLLYCSAEAQTTIPPIAPPAVPKYKITTLPYNFQTGCSCGSESSITQKDPDNWAAYTFYETTSNDIVARGTKPLGYSLSHFICSAKIDIIDVLTNNSVISKTFGNISSSPCGNFPNLDVVLPASALPTVVGAYKDFYVRHKNNIATNACGGGSACTPPPCNNAGDIIVGIFRVELLPPAPPPPSGSSTALQACQNNQFTMPYTSLGDCYTNTPQWRYDASTDWINYNHILGASNTFICDAPFSQNGDQIIETRVLHNPLCPDLVPIATDIKNMQLYAPARGFIKKATGATPFCPAQNPIILEDSLIISPLGSRMWEYSTDGITFTGIGSSTTLACPWSGHYRLSMTTQSGGCDGLSNVIQVDYPNIASSFLATLPTCGNTNVIVVKDNSENPEAVLFHVSINGGEWIQLAITDSLVHTLPSAGNVHIQYKIELSTGCFSSVSEQEVEVTPAVVNDFSVPPICIGELAKFEDLSTINFPNEAYFVGRELKVNGVSVWTGSSIFAEYTFTTAGIYTIELISTNNIGCSTSVTKTVVVNPPLIANFTLPFPNAVCLDILKNMGIINFAESSEPQGNTETISWDISPNSGIVVVSDTDTLKADFSNVKVGTHSITLTVVSKQSCTSTKTFTFTVLANPVANFLAQLPPCVVSPTSSLWVMDASNVPNGAFMYISINDAPFEKLGITDTLKRDFATSQMVEVAYYIELVTGCISPITTHTVFVQPALVPQISISTNRCVGETVEIEDLLKINYPASDYAIQRELRINGLAVWAGASKMMQYTFASSGLHQIKVITTTNEGCSVTTEQTIRVSNPLDVSIVAPFHSVVCLDKLKAVGVHTFTAEALPEGNVAWYAWATTTGEIISGADAMSCNIDLSNATVGEHNVTLTIVSLQGCTTQKTFTFRILPPVIAQMQTIIELDVCKTSAILKAHRTQDEAGWQQFLLLLGGIEQLNLLNTDSLEFVVPLTAQTQQLVLKYIASQIDGGCMSDTIVFEATLPALALPIVPHEIVISYPQPKIPAIWISTPPLPIGYEWWVNFGDGTEPQIFDTNEFGYQYALYPQDLGKTHYIVEMQLQSKGGACPLGDLIVSQVIPTPPAGEDSFSLLIDCAEDFTPNGDGINDYFLIRVHEPLTYQLEYLNFEVIDPITKQVLFEGKDLKAEWNGIFRGTEMPNGTYQIVVKVKVKDLAERTLQTSNNPSNDRRKTKYLLNLKR